MSNKIIQKRLAFGRKQSGTGHSSGTPVLLSGSCPAGLMAEVGLRWWRQQAASNRMEDSDDKVCKEQAHVWEANGEAESGNREGHEDLQLDAKSGSAVQGDINTTS
jgi:hypothetical protein